MPLAKILRNSGCKTGANFTLQCFVWVGGAKSNQPTTQPDTTTKNEKGQRLEAHKVTPAGTATKRRHRSQIVNITRKARKAKKGKTHAKKQVVRVRDA